MGETSAHCAAVADGTICDSVGHESQESLRRILKRTVFNFRVRPTRPDGEGLVVGGELAKTGRALDVDEKSRPDQPQIEHWSERLPPAMILPSPPDRARISIASSTLLPCFRSNEAGFILLPSRVRPPACDPHAGLHDEFVPGLPVSS